MTPERGGCQVLLAEDDPAIRALVGSALKRRKLQVEAVPNGQEALKRLGTGNYLVLILDLMMPDVNGWEVISWLASHADHRPKTVIVVSATDRALLNNVDPTVVNAIIFKPFDILQLAAYVKASCELPHQDRRHTRIVSDPVSL